MGIIYCAVNRTTGVVYIGKTMRTLDDRKMSHWKDSSGRKTHFHRALRKYGLQCFHWSEIDHADDDSVLCDLEREYIDMFSSSIDRIGYNMTHGGDGVIMNYESRMKMSATKKGKPSPMKGKHFSDKAVENIRASRVGIWEKHKHPMLGKRQSEESIQKMKETKLRNLVLYTKECSVCGRVFTAKVSFAKNCSSICNLRSSRARRKELLK